MPSVKVLTLLLSLFRADLEQHSFQKRNFTFQEARGWLDLGLGSTAPVPDKLRGWTKLHWLAFQSSVWNGPNSRNSPWWFCPSDQEDSLKLFGNCHWKNVVLLLLVLLSPGLSVPVKAHTWDLTQAGAFWRENLSWPLTSLLILIMTRESLLIPHSWFISLRTVDHVLKLVNMLVRSTPTQASSQTKAKCFNYRS